MTIWGWPALIEYTGLTDTLIKRAMGIYGFPKPVKVRKGKTLVNVWDEPLVSEWLNRSHMLYFMQKRRDELRTASRSQDKSISLPAEGT